MVKKNTDTKTKIQDVEAHMSANFQAFMTKIAASIGQQGIGEQAITNPTPIVTLVVVPIAPPTTTLTTTPIVLPIPPSTLTSTMAPAMVLICPPASTPTMAPTLDHP